MGCSIIAGGVGILLLLANVPEGWLAGVMYLLLLGGFGTAVMAESVRGAIDFLRGRPSRCGSHNFYA